MAKAGRKPKPGTRGSTGRLKKPTMTRLNEMAEEKRKEVLATVQSQPHRRPFAGVEHPDWCESALGRLCLVQRLRKEIFEAATDYADTRRRWRAAIEAPTDLRLNEGGMTGDGPSRATIARWRSELDGAEHAIVAAHGVDGFRLIERLVVDGIDLRPSQVIPAQYALETLAGHLLRITRRVSAFA